MVTSPPRFPWRVAVFVAACLVVGAAGAWWLASLGQGIARPTPPDRSAKPHYVFTVGGVVYRTDVTAAPAAVAQIRERPPDPVRAISYYGVSRNGFLFYLSPEPAVRRLNLATGDDQTVAPLPAGYVFSDLIVSADARRVAYEQRNDCGSPDNPPECITEFVLVDVASGERTVFANQRFPRGTLPEEFLSLVRFCDGSDSLMLQAAKSLYRQFPARAPTVTVQLTRYQVRERRLDPAFVVTQYHASSTLDFEESFWDGGRLAPDCQASVTFRQADVNDPAGRALYQVEDAARAGAKPLFEPSPTGVPRLSRFTFSGDGTQLLAMVRSDQEPSRGPRRPSLEFGIAVIEAQNPSRQVVYQSSQLTHQAGPLLEYRAGPFLHGLGSTSLSPDGRWLVYTATEATLGYNVLVAFDREQSATRLLWPGGVSPEVQVQEKRCQLETIQGGTPAAPAIALERCRQAAGDAASAVAAREARAYPAGWTHLSP